MMGYLKTYYPSTKPVSDYPEKLVGYLMERFGINSGDHLLEAGVGRSEHLNIFDKNGVDVSGFDQSEEALTFNNKVKLIDSEHDKWPYENNQFDVVYSKSFIEHLQKPVKYFEESYRVLKPGGILLTLTPDWEVNYKKFYDDFTHCSPFTKYSLEKILTFSGFEKIDVFKFRQLPIVWKHPALNIICYLVSPFIPIRTQCKFLRWSRELMLIGYGVKAHGSRT